MLFKNFFKKRKLSPKFLLEKPAETERRLREFIRNVFLDFDVLEFKMTSSILSNKIYGHYNMASHISILLQEKMGVEKFGINADGVQVNRITRFAYPDEQDATKDKAILGVKNFYRISFGRPFCFKAEQFLSAYEIKIIKTRNGHVR